MNFFTLFKKCTLLLMAFMLPFYVSAYAQLVSISKSNISLKEVFKEIKTQTNYNVISKSSLLMNASLLNLHVTNRPVPEVLDQVLQTQNLSYSIEGNTILIKGTNPGLTNRSLSQQSLTGRVVDQNQESLIGVSVSVKGTAVGTTTDEQGRFTIQVQPGQVLVFSYIGFTPQEFEYKGDKEIHIVLSEQVSDMDEVVVVGYGTQRRASVVGAITTINPQNLKMGTTRSLSNNLAGQLAGVIGVQRSGEPGYDNSSFWIRGISTFGGNRDPLVLVDGIERSLNNIDPEEIESFSILKDASASAVYGVRGANGVILINTKRGKIGKPTVSIRTERGITSPVKTPSFVGSYEYLSVMNSIREERGAEPLYSLERLAQYRDQSDPDLYPDVNWLKLITKDNAANLRTNVTVSGGSDILRYALVGSYFGENGIIDRDRKQEWDSSMKLKRYNMRSNVDVNLSPTTLFRLNLGGYLQDRVTPPQSIDNLFQEAFITPPYVHPAQYSSGEFPRTPNRQNPYVLATQTGYTRHSASKLESLFSLEQDLESVLPGLKAKAIFSFDRYSNNSVNRSKSPDYYNPATGRDEEGNLLLSIDSYGQEFLGYSTSSDWGDKSVYLEGNLAYSQQFGVHSVESMLLYNQRNYDNGSTLPFRNQGVAGRFSYSYDNRYIAEFNFGYNGSENFIRGKRFGFFPSFAAGWYLSEEPFMQDLKSTLSKVKFRGSYGLVGNDNLDGRRFAYITTIGDTDGYRWGVNNDYHRAGRWEGDQGNPNLTWETVKKFNLGLELGLWNNLEIQADYFTEKRRDIFMQRRTIPGFSGFINSPWANFGKVDNKGVDMSLDFNRQFSEDFFLNLRGTFTYAKNTIIEQDEPSAIIGTTRSSTGKSVGQLFGMVAHGLFTEADFKDIENGVLNDDVPRHTLGPVRPGDIRYVDLNNDGIIDALDRTAIGGTEDPRVVFGFGLNLRYKNFDFGTFFQGMGQTYRIIGGANFIPGSANGSMGNILTNVVDRWTVDNPRQDVFYPRLSDYQSANNNEASTWWLRDMSFIRMKNLEVGYNLPNRWVRSMHLERGRLFLRGSNLLTISDFKLWDPELGVNNGLRYPIMKSVSFGFEINL